MLNPADALNDGRAAIEDLMTDACAITRTTSKATNPDTAQVTTTATQVYAGKCRFQDGLPGGSPAPKNVGSAAVLVAELHLQLPVAVTGVLAGDLVTCTVAGDPALVGRRWRARPAPRKTHATKAVVVLVEVTG